MKIAVIDGKGGGLGKSIIESLRLAFKDDIEIIALGTNSQATLSMLKAGADNAATGENPICVMASKVDVIVGPIALASANSMFGEITGKMAFAIAKSEAEKVLIPVSKCNIHVCGLQDMNINKLLQDMNLIIQKIIKDNKR